MTHEEFLSRYQYDPGTDQIGKGGFGSVYKARDMVRKRYVAIKESMVDPKHKFTLQREVELSHEIASHPHVAKFENCYRFTAMRITMDYAVMECIAAG
jgi:serine/threonine protein kinase